MRIVLRNVVCAVLVVGAGVLVSACKSERITRFEKLSADVCACKDAACGKKAGTAFVDAFNGLEKENIDWQTPSGKKESAAITAAATAENACLEKVSPVAAANKLCTEDPKGKANTAGCTACCRDQGRAFKYWADPLAAGIMGALGGPKDKGCGCK